MIDSTESMIRVMLVFSTTGMKDQETQLLAMDTTACPPWFAPQNTSGTDRCTCINRTDIAVKCDQLAQRSYLLFGYCMTHDDSSGNTFLGRAIYCNHQKPTNHLYLKLPTNTSVLNDFMCGPLNRKGLLCMDCMDGFGPEVFTTGYTCENCTGHSHYGIALYLLLELVPTTAFYFLVLVFQIRVTSAPLNGFILSSQAVVIVYNSKVSVHAMFDQTGTTSNILANIVFTDYGIWNLEFFRTVVPPFCVSDKLKNVHALMLQYIPAVYPLCLIAITYACIKLHDRNFRPIVWLWRPFHKCFTRARRSWDTTSSIIDVFATFLLAVIISKILICVPVHAARNHCTQFLWCSRIQGSVLGCNSQVLQQGPSSICSGCYSDLNYLHTLSSTAALMLSN